MPRNRERQKEEQRRRYADYRRICAERGLKHRGTRWASHYCDLRGAVPRGPRVAPYRNAKREEIHRFWLERFSLEEIRDMAFALESCL